MKLNFNVKSSWIRILASAILLAIITLIVFEIHSMYNLFQEITPREMGNLLYILSFVLPYIFVVALFNIASNIKDSLLRGVKIGVISGVILFVFWAIYFEVLKTIYPAEPWEGGYGIIFPLSGLFTIFFIVSSIVGMLISYFIRKAIAKRRSN